MLRQMPFDVALLRLHGIYLPDGKIPQQEHDLTYSLFPETKGGVSASK
jgi:hypothetical protein